MDDKVYYPETIQENPLPGSAIVGVPANQSSSTKTGEYSPQSTPATKLPARLIARAVISETINTQTKKILGDYSFGEVGALRIGKYQNGVSGEMLLTRDGITAINVNGDTTFAVDATTGDATFKGTLQAGTLIGGDNTVVIEQGSSGGRIVLYNSGVPSILIGDPT